MLYRRLKFFGVLVALVVLVLGGSYLFAPQWLLRAHVMRQAMAAHVEEHTLRAGDTTWSYYEGGQGPTLVLLHGFAADKTVWLPLAAQLTPHFHLVIPDLPGWGQSSRMPDASYDVQAQAGRLQAFLAALKLQRFVLVGHSMGGAIAGVYAAGHPQGVAALALLDAYGLKARENDFDRAIRAGKDPFVYDDRAGFEHALRLAFLQPPKVPGRIEDVFVARNRNDRAFIQRTLAALRRPADFLSLQQQLGRLTMPVLGLWCREDRLVDPSALDSLRNGLVQAPAISSSLLTGCNHMPMMEKPEATAQVLTGFVLGR
ncbi:MAG TPA: alpha/beta fold hydrolase [Frateuria sp.]|uniref:alpha/beta fold hydrolase n=1 Tax=Frateuria sp. TaxID=2211372 RepID=UPI002D8059AE|nr:alpha/beta fold hydrolase [Frateuria sp.]HET6806642.1 alpha/beta fold hydrolase [Frateuria sp.]